MAITKKPTRKQLLQGITKLQGMVGESIGLVLDDRNKSRMDMLKSLLDEAHELCVLLRSFDPPTDDRP